MTGQGGLSRFSICAFFADGLRSTESHQIKGFKGQGFGMDSEAGRGNMILAGFRPWFGEKHRKYENFVFKNFFQGSL